MIEFILGVLVGNLIGILVVALMATIEALIGNLTLENTVDFIIAVALILFGVFLLKELGF